LLDVRHQNVSVHQRALALLFFLFQPLLETGDIGAQLLGQIPSTLFRVASMAQPLHVVGITGIVLRVHAIDDGHVFVDGPRVPLKIKGSVAVVAGSCPLGQCFLVSQLVAMRLTKPSATIGTVDSLVNVHFVRQLGCHVLFGHPIFLVARFAFSCAMVEGRQAQHPMARRARLTFLHRGLQRMHVNKDNHFRHFFCSRNK
tara:strand:+ start:1249 stop:1848 length:600 start_codon:yes stop_codon:yes gene_type:complete